MAGRPDFVDVDVDGATLGTLSWPGLLGAPTVVAIPGAWSTAWEWDPLAHHLAGAARLVAVDLRGRGRSLDQPGPFGIRRHADDVASIIDQLGEGPVLVVGYSMGATVALMTAERRPDAVRDLVLVDGGAPLGIEVDGNTDPARVDTVLDEVLGDTIARLGTVWPDRVSYLSDVAARRPGGHEIGPDRERNLLAELIEADGGFRLAVDVDAIIADGRDLVGDPAIASLLERRNEPTTIVRAEFDHTGTQPGLISPAVRSRLPQHRWIDAPGLDHSSIIHSPTGAALVADVLRGFLVTA